MIGKLSFLHLFCLIKYSASLYSMVLIHKISQKSLESAPKKVQTPFADKNRTWRLCPKQVESNEDGDGNSEVFHFFLDG